jgi:NADPH-dependent 2,4-dienoyl-CoA reductase/sulfur reductase-like enzyme
MSAAAKARRTDPRAAVIVLERGDYVSYAACGLPYFLSGHVASVDDLIVRSPEEHRAAGIDVRLRHEAIAIRPRTHQVRVRTPNGEESLSYDRLILATGASPLRPPFAAPGLCGVFLLRAIPDALAIRDHVRLCAPRQAVVVGAGYIGLEMVEALAAMGMSVTLVEHGAQVAKGLDADMAEHVSDRLRAHDVRVLLGREVVRLEGERAVRSAVLGDGESLAADMVVIGIGVRPNSRLAAEAGIRLGECGAIHVDSAQRTSELHIYAAGDCAEAHHLVLGRGAYIPLGTTASKQGRVAGENAVGGRATFAGVVGTAVCKVFDCTFARTGLTEAQARDHGFAPRSGTIAADSRAQYYQSPPKVHVKLTLDARTRRLLGGQLVGDETVAKRVDVVAAALHAGMTVDDFARLDLSYAPPYAPVWDPLLVAANVASR